MVAIVNKNAAAVVPTKTPAIPAVSMPTITRTVVVAFVTTASAADIRYFWADAKTFVKKLARISAGIDNKPMNKYN
jgi:hypothetical protein